MTAEKTKDPKLKSEILKELRKQEINIKEMKVISVFKFYSLNQAPFWM